MKSQLRIIGAFLVAALFSLGLTACKDDGKSASSEGFGFKVSITKTGDNQITLRDGAKFLSLKFENSAKRSASVPALKAAFLAEHIVITDVFEQGPGGMQLNFDAIDGDHSVSIDRKALGILRGQSSGADDVAYNLEGSRA